MSIPEAVILVLQAAASGAAGGETFSRYAGSLLILTVAEEMIRLTALCRIRMFHHLHRYAAGRKSSTKTS